MENKLILVAPIFCDFHTFNHKLYERSIIIKNSRQKVKNIRQKHFHTKDDLWMNDSQILRNKTTGKKLEQTLLSIDLSYLLRQTLNENILPTSVTLFYRDDDFDDRKFLCLVIESCIKSSFDTTSLEKASNELALELIYMISEQPHVIRWIGRTLICNEDFVPRDWVSVVPDSSDKDLTKLLNVKDCLFGWGNNLIVTDKGLSPQDTEHIKKGLVDAQFFWIRGETVSDEVSHFFESLTSEKSRIKQIRTLEDTTVLLEKYTRLYVDSDWYRKKAQGVHRIVIERQLTVWNYPKIVSVIGERLELAERIAERKRKKTEMHFQNAIEILLLATGLISVLSLLIDMFSLAYSESKGNIVTYFRQTDMDLWLEVVTALVVIIIINYIIHDIRR